MADAKQSALAALLQKFNSPNSAAGKLAGADAYRQHVINAQTSGEEPMTREQFIQSQQGG